MIQVGLVGVGGHGEEHLATIKLLQKEGVLALRAVVDPDVEHLTEVKALLESEGVRWYKDFEVFLEEEKSGLDAVILVTPIHLHFDMARQAVTAGLHVLLEKPPVPTIQEYDLLVQEDIHQRIRVGFQWLGSAPVQEVRRRLISGELGELVSIHGGACWPRLGSYYRRNQWAGKMTHGGRPVFDGPLTNALSHLVQNIMYLAGARTGDYAHPTRVAAELYRVRPMESYDTASVKGEFASGARFSLSLAHAVETFYPFFLEVTGTKGALRICENGDSLVSSDCPESVILSAGDGVKTTLYKDFLRICRGEPVPSVPRLKDCEGYVLTTNAALLSSGGIHDVDGDYRETYRLNGELGYSLRGISDLIHPERLSGGLFSATGRPWTRKAELVSTDTLRNSSSTSFFEQIFGTVTV